MRVPPGASVREGIADGRPLSAGEPLTTGSVSLDDVVRTLGGERARATHISDINLSAAPGTDAQKGRAIGEVCSRSCDPTLRASHPKMDELRCQIPMWRAVVVLIAIAGCAPKDTYTPRIDVEPQAEQRLCYVSLQAEKRDAGAWSRDIENACAELRSDVKKPSRVLWVDAADE